MTEKKPEKRQYILCKRTNWYEMFFISVCFALAIVIFIDAVFYYNFGYSIFMPLAYLSSIIFFLFLESELISQYKPIEKKIYIREERT